MSAQIADLVSVPLLQLQRILAPLFLYASVEFSVRGFRRERKGFVATKNEMHIRYDNDCRNVDCARGVGLAAETRKLATQLRTRADLHRSGALHVGEGRGRASGSRAMDDAEKERSRAEA